MNKKRRLKRKVLLTAILSWNSEVGTIGMAPPCFPNFLSKLSWTDTKGRERGGKTVRKRQSEMLLKKKRPRSLK